MGEAPGKQENTGALKHPPGEPFIGKTGEEVDRHYLPLAGLRRSDVMFHNAISCLPISAGGKLDPNQPKDLALLHSCAEANLYPLIEQMQPRLIIPLGNFACRAVLGDDFDLELKHGIPTNSEWGPTFPMHHPALGMHEPKKMLYIRTDWDRLRKYLRGTLVMPTDPYDGQEDYQEVTDESEIWALDDTQPLACDTESGKDGPYCLTYSQSPGTGRLIRAERRDLLAALQSWVETSSPRILFHNWLYDWSITEALGLRFPPSCVIDTMAVVYHLGNLPQGLKALSFRELGMTMMDFEDVVVPHSREKVVDYFRAAAEETWLKPDPEMVVDPTGKWELYKPQGLNTKLKRFFTDYRKAPTTKNVFRAWENWGPEQALMEERLGPWPGKDIRHVPFEQALFYAVRDADALGRLWPVIKKMRTLVRKFSQESWRERATV